MTRGGVKYRRLMHELDERGINITINRVGPKWYEVHKNFEGIKRYKTRRACNKYVTDQHKKHCI